MNFQKLLQQRESLVQRARLANIAFAWHRLEDFSARCARAQLRGAASLRLPDPEAERLWPVLVALESNQSVVEEHFTDEDIVELADLLAFAGVKPFEDEIGFRFESMARQFLPGLGEELRRAGIALPGATSDTGGTPADDPHASDGGTGRRAH